MIRSDVARVKCFECLMIIIRNQGGTAEDIRPFLLKKGTFLFDRKLCFKEIRP